MFDLEKFKRVGYCITKEGHTARYITCEQTLHNAIPFPILAEVKGEFVSFDINGRSQFPNYYQLTTSYGITGIYGDPVGYHEYRPQNYLSH